ncbi:hypothetical protein FB451DRAFT_1407083 [Mycena latifolia]|nr:hypothetical protein FB451DRAFT_1407083 [Mycena latifolia]
MSQNSTVSEGEYIHLVEGSLIPLHVVLAGLTWIIHDYFVTVEDEIRFIWSQRLTFSKAMFLWIRYYSIALLIFDAIQIHVFSVPGITSDHLCVAMDTIIRVVGAISLWSVEIIMQLRVYALYRCSKQIAIINAVLFAGSIAGFIWILVYNHARRADVIAAAIHLPLPGCPTVHSGSRSVSLLLLLINLTSFDEGSNGPTTLYEGILFSFALFKTCQSASDVLRKNPGMSIYSLLLRDNLIYFFAVACLLVFNNLMVVSVTHIPWFSYGPFHAAVGILTARMLLNLQRATAVDVITTADISLRIVPGPDTSTYTSAMPPMAFGGEPLGVSTTFIDDTQTDSDSIIQFSPTRQKRSSSPPWPIPPALT